MDDRIILGLALVMVALIGMVFLILQDRQLRKLRRQSSTNVATIRELQDELQAAHTAMHTQSEVIYDQAVQLHGRAAADRAVRNAHDRGKN